ncbi:hypothetical protein [Tuberibacillus sp. Marseille-P3662]|uniref:hypothetical protein n=1 Tax=Tuberibacillus sp. Marseille-P3662 TaxID=1965358 RepID=UPI000A1CBED4|nr:hypothetical protein [Tuberibacillus sp. Marseille-P3662]
MILPTELLELKNKYIVVSAAKETLERKGVHNQAIWDDLKETKQKMRENDLRVERLNKESMLDDYTVFRIMWKRMTDDDHELSNVHLRNWVREYIEKLTV